jgi:hypothetical protein
MMGTMIVPIRRVGDLERRDAERIFETYRELSTATSLMPPALAFILDRECRDAAEQADLRHRSQNLAEFIPRRMYENYLLNSDAIAAVMNSIENFRPTSVTAEEVAASISKKRREREYFAPHPAHEQDWIETINGAKLLGDLFNEMSETRVVYKKTDHSLLLTDWLIENSPTDLDEIKDLLSRCFSRVTTHS